MIARRLIPYLFLLPAIGLLAVFNLFPTIATLNESLHNCPVSGGRIFVGMETPAILNDPVFWNRCVTMVFNLLVNYQVILALGLAVLANRRFAVSPFSRHLPASVAVSINVTTVV